MRKLPLHSRSPIIHYSLFIILTKNLIHTHPLWRTLEIIPGALAWLTFLVPVLLSFFFPNLVASFIIIYTIIWLFRSIKLSVNLFRSYRLVKKALHTNWQNVIDLNDHPERISYEIKKLSQAVNNKNSRNSASPKIKLALKETQKLQTDLVMLQQKGQYKKSKELVHAIIYVTYKESYGLIRESIKSYTLSKYPPSRIIFVFAGEERDQQNVLEISQKIKHEFGHKFRRFMITIHPQNIPGEIKGKSANATFAAKELKKILDQEKIPYDNIIISNFDADTVVHPLYFTELTAKYLTTIDRTEKTYQPTHMFHNNIWDVPMIMRIIALSCTFWRMAESMEQDKYKSFSSRSLSFKMVIDVDYWDTAVIPEDSRQYWTAYAIYNGRHKLVPVYCPVYMDAVLSDTYLKTFRNQYNQLRRWAWGVCDFPFMALNLWYHPHLKVSEKIRRIGEFLKNTFFWATGPILITFSGFIPGLINADFRNTVLAYNLPNTMSDIMLLASGGIFVCAIISLILIPKTHTRNFLGRLSLGLQWLLVPITSIFLSAIPALDAQTRLMFGKYLEYRVTEKARKK